MTVTAIIRPYRPGDRDAVAEICVRTAAGGGDARGVYSSDDLMPEVYALPYVEAAPDMAWLVVVPDGGMPDGAAVGGGVLDVAVPDVAVPDVAVPDVAVPDDAVAGATGPGDERLRVEDGRAVGYVIATPDTAAFVAWWEREWGPGFVARHPEPGPPTGRNPGYTEAALLASGADPTRMVTPLTAEELADYPAHLHIDLLPEAQRQGLGRRLLDTLRTALADRGVPGVHLSMDPANTAARAFYDSYGFVELPSHRPDVPLLGIKTS